MSLLKQSIAITVLLLAAAAGAGQAESKHPAGEQRVEATGKAAIVNGDAEAATRAARLNMMRDAVERTIGAYVSGEAKTENSELIKDVVQENFRARALYERQGFQAVRTEDLGLLRFLFGFASSTVMVRPLE